jgi:hypothetical protein
MACQAKVYYSVHKRIGYTVLIGSAAIDFMGVSLATQRASDNRPAMNASFPAGNDGSDARDARVQLENSVRRVAPCGAQPSLQVNAEAGYNFSPALTGTVSVFNLLDRRDDC